MSESQPQESGLSAPDQQEHSPQQQDPRRGPRPTAAAGPAAAGAGRPAPGPAAVVAARRPAAGPAAVRPAGLPAAPQAGSTGKTGFTSAERFWYLLGNIALGAMYLRKVPAKKAMSEFGLVEMTSGEKTWYTILCILCGRLLRQAPGGQGHQRDAPFVASGQGLTDAGRFWYLLGCLAYGANYFAKVSPRRRCPTSAWPAERHRGRLVHVLCIACGSATSPRSRWPRPSARCRSSSRPTAPRSAAVGGQGAVATPPPHPAEPVHLWGAVRKDPHAALAQTEERRTRNA